MRRSPQRQGRYVIHNVSLPGTAEAERYAAPCSGDRARPALTPKLAHQYQPTYLPSARWIWSKVSQ
jgi:hypothetical protein